VRPIIVLRHVELVGVASSCSSDLLPVLVLVLVLGDSQWRFYTWISSWGQVNIEDGAEPGEGSEAQGDS
jgi:hypothetical protein